MAWIGSVQGVVATWSTMGYRMLITDQVATAPCTDPIQVRRHRSKSRKCETKLRATSFFRIEIHSAAVLLDHFADKREAQTCRFFVFLLSFTNDAIELVPHALLRLSGNSETTIFNTHAHAFSFERC